MHKVMYDVSNDRYLLKDTTGKITDCDGVAVTDYSAVSFREPNYVDQINVSNLLTGNFKWRWSMYEPNLLFALNQEEKEFIRAERMVSNKDLLGKIGRKNVFFYDKKEVCAIVRESERYNSAYFSKIYASICVNDVIYTYIIRINSNNIITSLVSKGQGSVKTAATEAALKNTGLELINHESEIVDIIHDWLGLKQPKSLFEKILKHSNKYIYLEEDTSICIEILHQDKSKLSGKIKFERIFTEIELRFVVFNNSIYFKENLLDSEICVFELFKNVIHDTPFI